jgi:nucleoside-diphosphate-sugar epimerase
MNSGAVLVTGVTCPLGQSVARMLVEQGRHVVGLGRRRGDFPALPDRQFHTVIGDLTDAHVVTQAVKNCDAVIHVAALSSPWARVADLRAINVDATQALLTAARAAGVRRFVQVSSASVTFHGTDAWNVCEDAPYPQRWLCAYSASKAAAEQVIRTQSDIETVILRPRAIYGPGDRTLLPRIIARARAGRLRRLVRNDVQQSLTYVDNVAHACVLAIDGPAGHIWNVADAEPVGLWHTIDTILARLGIAPVGRPVPTALVRSAAAVAEGMHRLLPFLGEPTLTRYTAALLTHHQTMSLAAIKRDLVYRPLVSGAEGLERTAAALMAAHS